MLVFIIDSKERPRYFSSPGTLEVWPCESCKFDHVAKSLRLYCSIREVLTHKQIGNCHLQPCVVRPTDVPRLVVNILHGHMDGWLAGRKRNRIPAPFLWRRRNGDRVCCFIAIIVVQFDIRDANSGGLAIHDGFFDHGKALSPRFILCIVCIPILLVSDTTILRDDSPTNRDIHTSFLEEMANRSGSMDSTKELPTPKAIPTNLVVFGGLLNFIVVFV